MESGECWSEGKLQSNDPTVKLVQLVGQNFNLFIYMCAYTVQSTFPPFFPIVIDLDMVELIKNNLTAISSVIR